jgi:multidrug efflux pump subunit AcrB
LTAKILNFGAPAPIDVQVNGPDMYANYEFVRKLVGKFREVPGAVDVVIQQTMRTPTLMVEGNRTFGLGVNRTLKDMADNLLMTTAGSQQVDQIYWLDPSTGMSYLINVYTPQPQINSLNSLKTIPIDSSANPSKDTDIQLLGNLADLSAEGTPGVITHGNIMPLFDIYISAEGRDLGGVLTDVQEIARSMESEKPRSAELEIHGQASLMHEAYSELISTDRGQLSIVARSVHYHYSAAGRAGGHRLGIVSHPYASVRAGAHWRHPDHGHGNGKFDSRRVLCPRANSGARRRTASGD